MTEKCVKIWNWHDAPQEYKDLSSHGGDEDWVLYCPSIARGAYFPMLLDDVIDGTENSYTNGFGHVDRHELENGDIVVIYAHA